MNSLDEAKPVAAAASDTADDSAFYFEGISALRISQGETGLSKSVSNSLN
jgi:hypothetical protein